LKTFLTARMALLSLQAAVEVSEGLYGDLAGNLERLHGRKLDAVVAMVEWADLDVRLGVRSSGGWTAASLADVARTAKLQLRRIGAAFERLSGCPRVLAGPTLPFPPVHYARSNRLSPLAAEIEVELAALRGQLAAAGVIVIPPQAVDRVSPPSNRFDVRSELAVGFPYGLDHADALAGLLAGEVCPPPRKKGLITDLDDTLWSGILGEVGVDGIGWTLERKAQLHGLYQQFVGSLASAGVLVAVASKNDPELVGQALARADMLVPASALFPVEAHWGPKSKSVSRILKAWNIGSDAVVFVDDSPMELAEVKAAFPDIECVEFPRDDPGRLWQLLFELRTRFGTAELTAEDSLRVASLRSRAEFEEAKGEAADVDAFLRQAQAELSITTRQGDGARAFELLNKTNQFNLNGARVSEPEWAQLAAGEHFVVEIGYRDRYGQLGSIAVLVGRARGETVTVENWVMSCRAFSRRIEHRCLQYLFDKFGAAEVVLRFHSTPRNSPFREFLATVTNQAPEDGDLRISRTLFERNCPPLDHTVRSA
jgi:FkbH-like protein